MSWLDTMATNAGINKDYTQHEQDTATNSANGEKSLYDKKLLNIGPFNFSGKEIMDASQSLLDSAASVYGNIAYEFGNPYGIGDTLRNYAQQHEQAMGENTQPGFNYDYIMNGGLLRDTGTLAGSVLSLAPVGAVAAGGAAALGASAPVVGAVGGIASALGEAAAEGGGTLADSLAQGLSLDEAESRAREVTGKNALFLGATNALSGGMMGKFLKGVAQNLAGKGAEKLAGGIANQSGLISQGTKETLKGAGTLGMSALNEGFQEAEQDAISASVDPNKYASYNPVYWSDEQWEDFNRTLGPTALMGLVGGAGGNASYNYGLARQNETQEAEQPGNQANDMANTAVTSIPAQANYTIADEVSDANLSQGTESKLRMLDEAYYNQYGQHLYVTSMTRHWGTNSDHETGSAFDVADDGLANDSERRQWIAEKARQLGLNPLDEYENPSSGATGGHMHFSDKGGAVNVDTSGWSGNADIDSLIADAANRYGIDANLLAAIAEQESGFNQGAKSEAGALGIMQLMPDTANGLGVDATDLAGNIEGGAKYIKQMLDQFGGDVHKALEAYNGGPGNVGISQTMKYADEVLQRYEKFKAKSAGTFSWSKPAGTNTTTTTTTDYMKIMSDNNVTADTAGDFLQYVQLLAEDDANANNEQVQKDGAKAVKAIADGSPDVMERVAKELGYGQVKQEVEQKAPNIPMPKIRQHVQQNGWVEIGNKKDADEFARTDYGKTLERVSNTKFVSPDFNAITGRVEQRPAQPQQIAQSAPNPTVQNETKADVAQPQKKPSEPAKRNDKPLSNAEVNILNSVAQKMPQEELKTISQHMRNGEYNTVRGIIQQYNPETALIADNVGKAIAISRNLLGNPMATQNKSGTRIDVKKAERILKGRNLDLINRLNMSMGRNLKSNGEAMSVGLKFPAPDTSVENVTKARIAASKIAEEGVPASGEIGSAHGAQAPSVENITFPEPKTEEDNLPAGLKDKLNKVADNLSVENSSAGENTLSKAKSKGKPATNPTDELLDVKQVKKNIGTTDKSVPKPQKKPAEGKSSQQESMPPQKASDGEIANSDTKTERELADNGKENLNTVITDETLAMARAMDGYRRSGKKLTQFVRNLAELGLKHGNPNQSGLFGENEAPQVKLTDDIATAKEYVDTGNQIDMFAPKYSRDKNVDNNADMKDNKNRKISDEYDKLEKKEKAVVDEAVNNRINQLFSRVADYVQRGFDDAFSADDGKAGINKLLEDSRKNDVLKNLLQYANRFSATPSNYKEVLNTLAPGLNTDGFTKEQLVERYNEYRDVAREMLNYGQYVYAELCERHRQHYAGFREHGGQNAGAGTVRSRNEEARRFDWEREQAEVVTKLFRRQETFNFNKKHSEKNSRSAFSFANPDTAEELKSTGDIDTPLDRLPKLPASKLRDGERKIQAFGKAIGVPVHFVSHPDKGYRGVFTHNGEVYINRNATVPAKAIFLHEFTHWLKASGKENRAVFDALAACVERESGLFHERRLKQYRDRIFGGEQMTDEEIIEEIICDAMGNSKTAERISKAIDNFAPELNQSIWGRIKAMWDKFCQMVGFRQELSSKKQSLPNGLSQQEMAKFNAQLNILMSKMRTADGKPMFKVKDYQLVVAENGKRPAEMFDINNVNDYVPTYNIPPMPSSFSYQVHAQREAVRQQYEGTKEWMKAPNGELTNLTEEQWLDVRTPNFKAWFGDWENNPDEASKVVDENGEPLVVYHGRSSKLENDTIRTEGMRTTSGTGAWFSNKENISAQYGDNIYPCFLNIRSPYTADLKGAPAGEFSKAIAYDIDTNEEVKVAFDNGDGSAFKEMDTYITGDLKDTNYEKYDVREEVYDTDSLVREVRNDKNVDGVVIKNVSDIPEGDTTDSVDYDNLPVADDYVVFNSNQIKSATENTGAFSPDTNNIKFSRTENNNNQNENGVDNQQEAEDNNSKPTSSNITFDDIPQRVAGYVDSRLANGALKTLKPSDDVNTALEKIIAPIKREVDNQSAKYLEPGHDNEYYQARLNMIDYYRQLVDEARRDFNAGLHVFRRITGDNNFRNAAAEGSSLRASVQKRIAEIKSLKGEGTGKDVNSISARTGQTYERYNTKTQNVLDMMDGKHSEQGAFSDAPKYSRDKAGMTASTSDSIIPNAIRNLVKKVHGIFVTPELPKNVSLKERREKQQISLVEDAFSSPARIAEHMPEVFKPYIEAGLKAQERQEKLRAKFLNDMNEISKLLGYRKYRPKSKEYKKRVKDFNKVMLAGDHDQCVYTDEELRDEGLDENTIKAYRKMREILDEAWNMVNTTKEQLKFQTTIYRNEAEAENDVALKKKKNPFIEVYKKSINDEGQLVYTTKEPKVIKVDNLTVTEKELKNLKANKNIYITAENKISGDTPSTLTYSVSYYQKNNGLGKIKGYIPHVFHEWQVMEADANGKVIHDGDNPRIIKTFSSRGDAFEAGIKLGENNKNKHFVIAPKIHEVPGASERAALMGDYDYHKTLQKIADSMTVSTADAKRIMDDTIKTQNKRRFLGYTMRRKGVKGYEENVMLATYMYLNQASRYVALDPFKQNCINMYNRTFGSYDSEKVLENSDNAAFIRGYINDVNGVPSKVEKHLNKALKNIPIMKGVAGGRYSIWFVNTFFTYPMTIMKLGVLNPGSALLNMTQLFNLFGAMGENVTSKEAYQRLIRKGFIDAKKGITDKNSALGKLLWDDLGLEGQIGADIAGGYSRAELSGVAAISNGIGRLAGDSMYLFRLSDTYTRAVTLLTAYNKALDEGKSKQEAIEYAKHINRRVNFDYSIADTPRFLRTLGPLGNLLFQFQKYPIKQLELFKDIYDDGRNMKLNKKRAYARLLKYMTPYLAMSGAVGGFPFASTIGGILAFMFGEDDDDWKQKATQYMFETFGQDNPLTLWFLYGAGAFVGMNIGSRVGVGDFLGVDNRPKGRMELILSTTTLTSTAMQVHKQVSYGNYAEAIKALSPAVGNIIIGAKGEVRTTRGRMKYQYQNAYEQALRMIGLNPLNETMAGDIASNDYANKQADKRAKDDAIDDFLDEPTAENAARLNELGVTPKSIQTEMARRKMNRAELNRIAEEEKAAKAKKSKQKKKQYSASDYLTGK